MQRIIRTIPLLSRSLLLLLSCLVLPALSGGRQLADCPSFLQPAVQQLQAIEEGLVRVSSLEQYRDAVMARYDVVERLLRESRQCQQLAASNELQRLQAGLSALQASAQASAFSKFGDWVTAREKDLAVCRQALAKPAATDD